MRFFRNKFDFYKNICYNIYVKIEEGRIPMKINSFDIQIHSDERCNSQDWVNDVDDYEDDDEFDND